jgi:hypothetical protein
MCGNSRQNFHKGWAPVQHCESVRISCSENSDMKQHLSFVGYFGPCCLESNPTERRNCHHQCCRLVTFDMISLVNTVRHFEPCPPMVDLYYSPYGCICSSCCQLTQPRCQNAKRPQGYADWPVENQHGGQKLLWRLCPRFYWWGSDPSLRQPWHVLRLLDAAKSPLLLLQSPNMTDKILDFSSVVFPDVCHEVISHVLSKCYVEPTFRVLTILFPRMIQSFSTLNSNWISFIITWLYNITLT